MQGAKEAASRKPGEEVKKRPLKQSNLNTKPEDYSKTKRSGNTVKSTNYAVNTFNETMKAVAEAENTEYCELKNIPESELPMKVARFLMLVTQRSGAPMNASSLQTMFASLARFLAEDYEPKTDIKNDLRFKTARENLKAAQKESAMAGATAGKNRSEAFKDQHVAMLWDKGQLGQHNPQALINTVQFIMISQLGFRAAEEVYNVMNEDVVFKNCDKDGVPEKVEVSERVTKTRQGGKSDVRDLMPGVFQDETNLDTRLFHE